MSKKRGRNDTRSVAAGRRQPGAGPPPAPPPLPPAIPGDDRGRIPEHPCPSCGTDDLWYGSFEGPDDELVTRCVECDWCPWDTPVGAPSS